MFWLVRIITFRDLLPHFVQPSFPFEPLWHVVLTFMADFFTSSSCWLLPEKQLLRNFTHCDRSPPRGWSWTWIRRPESQGQSWKSNNGWSFHFLTLRFWFSFTGPRTFICSGWLQDHNSRTFWLFDSDFNLFGPGRSFALGDCRITVYKGTFGCEFAQGGFCLDILCCLDILWATFSVALLQSPLLRRVYRQI